MIKTLCVGFMTLFLSLHAGADNLEQVIPEILKPWTSWVLRDNPDIHCPHLYNADQHFCAYPSSLRLNLQTTGGQFEQSWTVYDRSWIKLPGNTEQWPLNVTSNNKRIAIINQNGQPAIALDDGEYTIKGKFAWRQTPKSLQLPANTGLVYVKLDGKPIPQPDIRNGKLWLNTMQSQIHENNRLTLTVFRKISDTQPLKITTVIEMDVAGQPRETVLDGALLKGFSAAGLYSQLPARIDQNGQLRLQIRPGHWEVSIDSIKNAATTAIQLTAFASPWPVQELWAFEHQAHLRQVQITDKNTIDPQQTRLPAHWKHLPTYALGAGETLQWTVIKRGDPNPEPDQLNLKKSLWLDFTGEAYTVKDEISGRLSRHWRLNVSPEVSLGQAMVDGQPQYITRLKDESSDGIELRQGNVNLIADSRIARLDGALSASGWQTHFNQVSATLNLPMGYQLFKLSGAHAPGSWLNQWTLLDLFLVLITAIACYRLWGLHWGIIALLTLTLTWHEIDAPQLIWLNLIMTIALIKALGQGRLLKILSLYRSLVMLALVLTSLVFVVYQARTALYPQLERHSYGPQPIPRQASRTSRLEVEQAREEILAEPMVGKVSKYEQSYMDLSSGGVPKPAMPKPLMMDPDAMIQTGPGLPNWTWRRYAIQWDGPVQENQTIEITLISPAWHRLLNIMRILLVISLVWRLFDRPGGDGWRWSHYMPTRALGNWCLLPLLIIGAVQDARADYPSAALLEDLKKHLLKPADCLPQCATIESLHIKLSGDSLLMTVKAHASKEVALPLPVPIHKWLPSKVQLDLKPAKTLFRRQDQTLWLSMKPGVHNLLISGTIAQLSEFKIDFQLKPQHISYDLSGWSADISGDQIKQAQSLGFHRIANNETPDIQRLVNNDIPVFAEVTRHIELGLDWTVSTTVSLTAGNALPSILQVPLIDGESVITDGITVKNRQAIVTLNQTTPSVQWRSTLAKTSLLRLIATDKVPFNEIWQLNTSPIWHIDYDGIPVIYHQRQGQHWQPEWHPWPMERVKIHISRPEGIKGNTKTIDQSQLVLTPGQSLTTAKLSFDLRSSLGGQHTVSIPADSELMSVMINGNPMPVRLTAGTITLPINPGPQSIAIEWREPRGIGAGVFGTTDVNLGTASVNASLTIKPGHQRWVLFAGGPLLGPAVLFWGVFFVIVLIAIGLSRIKDMPLNVWHWLLLGIGLSASAPAAGVLIVGWLLALRSKAQMRPISHAGLFNLYQVILVGLTALSLLTLFYVIQQGLLGTPDMQITGNHSGRYALNWYTDRSEARLANAWLISVPLVIYRVIMLLWAIWLAFALLHWLRWGWSCYTSNGYWREWHWSQKQSVDPHTKADNGQS